MTIIQLKILFEQIHLVQSEKKIQENQRIKFKEISG